VCNDMCQRLWDRADQSAGVVRARGAMQLHEKGRFDEAADLYRVAVSQLVVPQPRLANYLLWQQVRAINQLPLRPADSDCIANHVRELEAHGCHSPTCTNPPT